MVVYLIENTVNGKRYVGKTVYTLSNRWSLHKSDSRRGSKNPLHAAIRKYGAESFATKELLKCNDLEILSREERRLIVELGTHVSTGKGYNATWGGDGTEPGERSPAFGTKRTKEIRDRLSSQKKGENNPSYKAKGAAHWNRGLVRSEETRAKLRTARTLQGGTFLGKHHSYEAKERIRRKRAIQTITPRMQAALAEGRKKRLESFL